MILDADLIFDENEENELFELWRQVDHYCAKRRLGALYGTLNRINQLYKLARSRATITL